MSVCSCKVHDFGEGERICIVWWSVPDAHLLDGMKEISQDSGGRAFRSAMLSSTAGGLSDSDAITCEVLGEVGLGAWFAAEPGPIPGL